MDETNLSIYNFKLGKFNNNICIFMSKDYLYYEKDRYEMSPTSRSFIFRKSLVHKFAKEYTEDTHKILAKE